MQLMKNNITMDSREIAELTGKEHRKVCRDIESMFTTLGGSANFGHTYIHPQNKQEFRCFKLPKRETLILVSGYSIPLRAKIIDRLEYLENKNKPTLPGTFSEALKLAYEQSLVIEQQESKLLLQAPKVALADECIRDENEHYSITNAGKHLGLSRTKIFSLLREKRLITVDKLPTQLALNKELLSIRTNIVNGKNFPQTIFTMNNIYNFKRIYEKDFK